MHSNPNARLIQKSRLRLINQHLQDRRPLAELAAEAGISFRCAYKWLARFRSGGAASLADRRSDRRTQRRTLDPQQQQHAVELRHQRLHLRHIARLLAAPWDSPDSVDTDQGFTGVSVRAVMNACGRVPLRGVKPEARLP